MSFYRTYRPKVFEEIDNTSVREALRSLLTKDNDKLPHAFLFTGPRGTGKTTAARLIAKLFNCTHPKKSGEPCGECDMCTGIAKGTLMDVLEIDAASNTGVDNIRDLKDKIMLAPGIAKRKVYIIDEVHMLSTGAFNALLKTLEEPPEHAVFILATTDPHKVPLTVQSRCLVLSFTRPSIDELVVAMNRIIKAEKLKIPVDAVKIIAEHADGSFRDAAKLLEQVSLAGEPVHAEGVRKLLAISEERHATDFLSALHKRNAKEALTICETLAGEGKDIRAFMIVVEKTLHRRLLSLAEGNKDDMWTINDLSDLMRRFAFAFAEMKYSPISQLPLELAVVEFCESKQPVGDSPQLPAKRSGSETVIARSLATKDPQQEIKESVVNKPSREDTIVSPGVHTRTTVADAGSKPEEPTHGAHASSIPASAAFGLITLEKLTEHWSDFIAELRPFNHSLSGVLRSTRPKSAGDGKVVIEAFYPFHKERLDESRAKEVLVSVLKKLFGEAVKVEIVLGKK